MKIRLGELRAIVRRALLEDKASFLSAVEPVLKDRDESIPRAVKKLWNDHADHSFFEGLDKVHWVLAEDLEGLLSPGAGGREISVSLYRPGAELVPAHEFGSPARSFSDEGVELGVKLDGRVVLASNNMDSLFTGYGYSGAKVKRGRVDMQEMWAFNNYILDAKSFRETSSDRSGRMNEGLLAHWHPIAVVMGAYRSRDRRGMKRFIEGVQASKVLTDFFRRVLAVGGSPLIGPDGESLDIFMLDDNDQLVPTDPEWNEVELTIDKLKK